MPAITVYQLTNGLLPHRYRSDAATRQASSHRFFRWVEGRVVSTLAFGPGHIRPTILLQMLNDDPRHILAGGGLDPFQAR